MKIKEQRATTKIQLTSKEKSELLFEGILTVVLLILLNIAVLALAKIIIDGNSNLKQIVLSLRQIVFDDVLNVRTYPLEKIAIFFLVILDIGVLTWRLVRRYHQMQLRHIIKELHYIAEGNYHHQIPFELNGDLGRIIKNVNHLVNNAVTAMEEERKIEQSKDELITNISHDIRTPLTSIIGYLGLIEEGHYQSNEELLHYTHTAFKKSKQMKTLVDDLFEYTKVRQTNTKLNIISFDLHQLLEQLVVDFDLEAKRKDMLIDVICEHSPLMMEGDNEKLVRVFNNLITNALKYGKDGNQVLLIADKTENESIITVKNNGPGIPDEALDQIFERFYRVDSSRSQEITGTGLGLAIAQSIVSLHHGKISVQSDNGWTSFIIRLPLTQEKQMNKAL